ncbi:MAG: ECF transporter S component [Gemmiger sp.]
MNNIKTRNLVFAALCTALCVVLPQFAHMIPNAAFALLPMHLPVLLCGLACGPFWGVLCGLAGPVLSSLLTGMPGSAMLPSMMIELAVYGLVAGAMVRALHTGRPLADLYLALVTAMLAGRVTYGVLNALIFKAGAYSMTAWLTSAFVTGLPGIVIQLALLPALVTALRRARVLA